MGVYERLEHLMREREISKYRLAKLTDITTSSLSDWSSGRVQPSAKAVQQLAEFFGVPMGYFYGETEQIADPAVRIPILGKVVAGIPLDAIEEIDGWEEIPESWTRSGSEFFALKVTGMSMFPEYSEGEILIIRRQENGVSGKDCIVSINGTEATFKRVFLEHGGMRLHPLNPQFEDVYYNGAQIKKLPITILGVVVQSRRTR